MPVDGAIVPQHEQFLFDGYILPETFHEPRIYVYPAEKFASGNEIAAPIIASMEQFLEEQPDAPEDIPFLPLFNARPIMLSQVKYLDFEGGMGVRFLTQYAQAFIPINNQEMFYTFQGLTDDGSYYVVAIFPTSHPALPQDGTAPEDYDAFVNNFDNYRLELEAQLNDYDPSTYTPDLEILDAVIQSLSVAKQ
jgi:hypothetical protein